MVREKKAEYCFDIRSDPTVKNFIEALDYFVRVKLFDKSTDKQSSTDEYYRTLGQIPDLKKLLDETNQKIEDACSIIDGYKNFE